MNGCIKVFLRLLIAFILFMIIIILLYKGAMRPIYEDHRSRITGMEITEGDTSNLANTIKSHIVVNSNTPIIWTLRVHVRDTVISSRKSWFSHLMPSSAQAAVDPGWIFQYSFEESIARISIFGLNAGDTTEISESFNLCSDRICYPQNDSSFVCSNNEAADFMMRRMSYENANCRSFVLYQNNISPLSFEQFYVKVLFPSGRAIGCKVTFSVRR